MRYNYCLLPMVRYPRGTVVAITRRRENDHRIELYHTDYLYKALYPGRVRARIVHRALYCGVCA